HAPTRGLRGRAMGGPGDRAGPGTVGADRIGLCARHGHVGLRGNLDEGEPFGLPGTYLAGYYETRPLPYAEPGYGDPEDGQTVVNADGKIIRLSVHDDAFDVRYAQ